MVDYSKWNALELDSDDDVGAPAARGAPRVTRLADGESVTVGGITAHSQRRAPCHTAAPGPKIVELPDDAEAPPAQEDGGEGHGEHRYYEDEAHAAREAELRAAAAREEVSGEAAAAREKRAADDARIAEQRRERRRAELTADGAACEAQGYLWSQDADTVTLHALVPAGTRARQVRVQLLAREYAAGTRVARAIDVSVDGTAVVAGELGGAVEVDEDEDDEDIDWSLQDLPGDARSRRLVSVCVRKLHPGAGVRRWWDCALVGGQRIDTTAIAARATYGARANAGASASGGRASGESGRASGSGVGGGEYKTFKEVFAEAEAMFKEKVRNRKPVEIDLSNEGARDGDAVAAGSARAPTRADDQDRSPLPPAADTGREW